MELLTLKDLMAKFKTGRHSVDALIVRPDFPGSLAFGEGGKNAKRRWASTDIDAWIAAQPRGDHSIKNAGDHHAM